MIIPKICIHCNNGFIAKTTVTKYCSLNCARRENKKIRRNEKILAAQKHEFEKSVGIDMDLIQTKEFLSIKETCLLLGISRMSLHRYIKQDLIQTAKLGDRVIIRKQSINNLNSICETICS